MLKGMSRMEGRSSRGSELTKGMGVDFLEFRGAPLFNPFSRQYSSSKDEQASFLFPQDVHV